MSKSYFSRKFNYKSDSEKDTSSSSDEVSSSEEEQETPPPPQKTTKPKAKTIVKVMDPVKVEPPAPVKVEPTKKKVVKKKEPIKVEPECVKIVKVEPVLTSTKKQNLAKVKPKPQESDDDETDESDNETDTSISDDESDISEEKKPKQRARELKYNCQNCEFKTSNKRLYERHLRSHNQNKQATNLDKTFLQNQLDKLQVNLDMHWSHLQSQLDTFKTKDQVDNGFKSIFNLIKNNRNILCQNEYDNLYETVMLTKYDVLNRLK